MTETYPVIGVEPVAFLAMIFSSAEVAAYQDLISSKCCLQLINSTDVELCNHVSPELREQIKSKTSEWVMYYNVLRNILPLVFSFYVGPWNEKLGWKRPMMIPPAFAVLACLNLLMCSVFIDSSLGFVLISPVLLGISTDSLGLYASLFGHLSDTTTSENRSKRMTVLQAFIIIGRAVGGFVAAALMASASYSVVFLTLMAINASAVLYTAVCIPSIKSKGARNVDSLSELFSLSNITDTLKTLFRRRENNVRLYIGLLFMANFVQYLGFQCIVSLAYIFVTDEPLNWTAGDFSILIGVTFTLQGLAMLFLVPAVYHFFAVSDSLVGVFSGISRLLSLTILGLSSNTTMVFSAISVNFLSDADMAAVRSILTKVVEPSEKGNIMAALGTLQTLSKLSGSFLFNGLYPVTVGILKGLPFEIGGALQLISVLSFVYLYRNLKIVRTGYEAFESEKPVSFPEKDSSEKVEKEDIE